MSLGSVKCSEDNDFILPETNYFNSSSQQHMDESCSSNDTPKAADTDDCCSSECTRTRHHVPEAEHSDSKLEDLASEKTVDMDHLKTLMRSKYLSEICDGTSTAAHMVIGQILDKLLLTENGEVDELTKHYLGGGLVSESPRGTRELLNVAEKNLKGDIQVHAVEHILPNLPKSCVDRVKRLMS